MKVTETVTEMKRQRREMPEPVGLVPTMGYLHEGHLSLVRQARAENTTVFVSIFVNPTQFGQNEDFADYPRDTERDLAILREEKVDVVFMPSADDMYSRHSITWVNVDEITSRLEGISRPTHFRGVTTVCAKLFNIMRPARAYFGQKDAQQLTVIRQMVSDLNMNLDIVACPIIREPDGLAMSSRNVYLEPEQRQQATVLYRSLELAAQMWTRGERDPGHLRRATTGLIREQPLADIVYVSVADTETLEEMEEATSPVLVSLAVRFGKTRLIDNIVLGDGN